MRKVDQATLIIIDIGRNVSKPEEKKEKSFFDNAKECASRIIERKILSQGNNYVGIILLGSRKTKNNMAELRGDGAFSRIELLAELQTPTWKMIRDLPETPSNRKGDWLNSLVVAADHLINGVSDVKFANMKIILMTNFQAPTYFSSKDIEQLLNGLKEDGLEVDIIGPDIYEDNPKNGDLELASQILKCTNGTTATFDNVMRYLIFHRKKVINPAPSYVDLSVGPNLKIPVTAYIRLRDEPVVGKWIKAVSGPNKEPSTTEGVTRNRVFNNTENQTTIKQSQVIKGYHYGQQIIPFVECDESMIYKSGERTLSVYGFTHASNIQWQSLNGDGLSYIFGRKGDKKAQHAVRCLVECLHELNLVGVVRKVHSARYAPKMFALMPVIDTNNYVCLSMIPLCYKDDIKYMAFPPTNLKKYACSSEQVNGFKDLIRAMDLTKAYDGTFDDNEAFPTGETVSPSAQFVLDCIAYRAMNPGKPLTQPRDEIMSLFKIPPLIEIRSREPLEKVKNLFTLNKVEVKKKKLKSVGKDEPANLPSTSLQPDNDIEMPMIQLPVTSISNKVHRIGTIDPVGDYIKLASGEKSLADLSPGMTEAIESLINCNLDGKHSKALDAMLHFRKECVNADPSHYNNWLQHYKAALTDRKRFDILSLIKEKDLNFILKFENDLSKFDSEESHEESQLYEKDTEPNSMELTITSDVNDMFDEM